jgi:hypothetical protein
MNRMCCIAALFAIAAARLAAEVPATAGFTFQGYLRLAGSPASGPFDLRFRLFDAATDGTQVGANLTVADVPVSDGAFSTTLDFGAAPFNGNARWVEVSVLDDGTGQYVALSPRQALSAVPYAVNALSHNHWPQTSDDITNDNVGGFVGINTASPVSGSDYFGVRSPVQSGYGGMYIRTDGPTAKPFYGLSTGTESVWTYLDGASGAWRIYNDGDRMTVTDTGRVGIGTTSPSASLHVHNAPGSTEDSLRAVTHGTERAAVLESHQPNADPAVTIYKNQGTALETTGDMVVDGDTYTGTANPLVMGTPIAFGCFNAWGADPAIKGGTGNFTVSTNPNWGGFLITVDDDSDPATWIVQASLTYAAPQNFGSKVEVRLGLPDANGTFRVTAACYSNCDTDILSYGTQRWNFVVYRP